MATQQSNNRQLLFRILRFGITIGALIVVVSQITWKDRLQLADGRTIHGWTQYDEQGVRVLAGEDGRMHRIPPDPVDITAVNPYLPGFITLLRGINVWLFIAAALVFPGIIVLTAWRWQLLLRTHNLDPGFVEALRLTWIGVLMNNVLPAGSSGGDLVKGLCIYRRSPSNRTAAVMTVLMDRVLGLVSLMLVGAVATLSQSGRPELERPSTIVRGVLVAILVGGMIYFSGRIRKLFRVSEIIAWLPMNEQIRKVDDSMFHYRSHTRTMVQCVGISLVVHTSLVLMMYVAGESLGMRVSMVNYFVFLPVIFTVGAVLPSVGGLGVLEGGFQWAFSLPGVGATPSSAVALCVLYRIITILGSLPGALPTYREFAKHPWRTAEVPPAPDSQENAPPVADGNENTGYLKPARVKRSGLREQLRLRGVELENYPFLCRHFNR